MTVLELTPESRAGAYEVLTSSGSRYLVVVAEETTVSRVPGAAPSVESYWGSVSRYRDTEPLVCSVVRFVEGQKGVLQYVKEERRSDPEYVVSTRVTTPVTSIRLLPAE